MQRIHSDSFVITQRMRDYKYMTRIQELEAERDAALSKVKSLEQDLSTARESLYTVAEQRNSALAEQRNSALAERNAAVTRAEKAKTLLASYQRGWENQRMDLVSERNAAQAERDRLRVALEIAMREHARASWTQIDNAMKAEEKP